jgi:hypothetical protein
MSKFALVEKRVLNATRVRRIHAGFSWIDRRFVRDAWIDRLSREEMLLYFFLVSVADKEGLSFYSDGRIEVTLKMAKEDLARARHRLVELDLIAYEDPLYQALALPESKIHDR